MSTKEDITRQIEALQGLLHNEGWIILSEYARKQAAAAMANMRNAKTQDDLLKATYTYMAVTDVMASPDVILKALLMQLTVIK